MKKFLCIAILIAATTQSMNAYSKKSALVQAVSAYNVDSVRQILDQGLATKQEIEDELAALLFMLLDKLNLEVIRLRATGDAKYDFIIREQDSVE